ncbi:hypothetical protein SERLA73DRAFT_190352 [Serpula lacrymans var. lacrymans S7.3]|uniref:DUF6534 domain-containing protein n=2 Tax=Serpula lacrymans var. lacrymans TaxID=341189 RepID=F8QFJ4_SERL3|nr:uncharacterized protein SERLADRAFT_479395 [Serpula lacrymans var. lacrymans S7.9]EGN92978.1 hypothetical protein SERLA73DRAFT_190352 [Serpula lacrymans var. lacrymans S7.3]EGO19690.1 hypothetical protein SERLADRAFT_479395 [Serpula lacrymans var. lacrymans S7.9]
MDGLSRLCLACSIYPSVEGQLSPLSCGGYPSAPEPVWSYVGLSALTGLISSMVHGFFCWRLWVISKSFIVPCLVMMISLLQCIMVIYDAVHSISEVEQIEVGVGVSYNPQQTDYLGGTSAAWGDYLWLGGSLVCDLIITIQTTRLLFKNKSASEFKKTKSLLTKLIKLTIETGMVTSVATLVELMMAVKLPAFYHFLIFYSLSKLYANCMMATLNARLVLRSDTDQLQVTTALFEAPHRNEALSSPLRFRQECQQCRCRIANSVADDEPKPFSESEDIGSRDHETLPTFSRSTFRGSEIIIIEPPLSESSTED